MNINFPVSAFNSSGHSGHWLDNDLPMDGAAIGREGFLLRHKLVNHPLLTLDALAVLADSLPVKAIECLEGMQNVVAPGIDPPLLSRPSETVLGIENNGRWMVLLNIEQNSAYRDLLNELLAEIKPSLPGQEGRMGMGEAFIFLSSPGSTTPAHIDPEHNFLLQIRGSKRIKVGQFRHARSKRWEIERYLDGGHRNLRDLPPEIAEYSLLPGFGLYLPPWQPHWVSNGPSVSISLSITFRTQRSERFEFASKFNSKMRKLGFSPRSVGESLLVDSMKAALMKSKGWLGRGGKARRSSRDYS